MAGILLVLDALSYRSFIAFTLSRSSSQAWTAISTMADLFRGPLAWSSWWMVMGSIVAV